MALNVVPYETEHLELLADFGNQEEIYRPFLAALKKCRYEDSGPAFSAFVEGRIVGCAGLVEVTPYRAYTWALMAKQDVAQRFVAIHRAVKGFLDEQDYKRIDMHVAFNDAAAHRWARLLGFEREVFCRPWYNVDGSAVSEYVRWG